MSYASTAHSKRPWRTQKKRRSYIRRLLTRDGNKCQICGLPFDLESDLVKPADQQPHKTYITFDHILSRSFGGTNDLDNLQLTHYYCNWKKGLETEKELL